MTGSDPQVAQDAPQITALRSAIDAACACAAYDGSPGKAHRNYVACASERLRAAVASGDLRRECSRSVRSILTSSTCGTDPALHEAPCVSRRASDGRVTCSVKPTTRRDGVPTNRCADRQRSSRVSCVTSTSCVDAADTNHDLVVAAPGDSGECVAAPEPTATPVPTPAPIDCVVTDWSVWGSCSAFCGGGTQSRTRQVVTQPQNGGAACPSLTDQQACNQQPCPIDCVVSAWSDWSSCSVACGGGTQTRSRQITTSPQNGGAACPSLSDQQPCNPDPCP